MLLLNVKANVVTYTALVNAFARQGNVTGSIEAFPHRAVCGIRFYALWKTENQR